MLDFSVSLRCEKCSIMQWRKSCTSSESFSKMASTTRTLKRINSQCPIQKHAVPRKKCDFSMVQLLFPAVSFESTVHDELLCLFRETNSYLFLSFYRQCHCRHSPVIKITHSIINFCIRAKVTNEKTSSRCVWILSLIITRLREHVREYSDSRQWTFVCCVRVRECVCGRGGCVLNASLHDKYGN